MSIRPLDAFYTVTEDDLFTVAGLPLLGTGTAIPVSTLAKYASADFPQKRYGHLFVVEHSRLSVSTRKDINFQLCFSFMDLPPSKVVRLVPPRLQQWLSYTLKDLSASEPELADTVRQLERSGVTYLGDLVQMSEDQLRALPFMSEQSLAGIRTFLSRARLGFDSALTRWNRPTVAVPKR